MTPKQPLGEPLLFPDRDGGGHTALVLAPDAAGGLPVVSWLGVAAGADAASLASVSSGGCSLLAEQARGWYTRPGLRGHRLGDAPAAGRDWSPAFGATGVTVSGDVLTVEADDASAGLALRTEVEALPGGSLRLRHALRNTGEAPYVVDGLEVVLPVPERYGELLDFTGRWGRERTPQRQPVTDGLWLRENRRGKTGHDAVTMVVLGEPGFDFDRGEVVGVHVAWSGDCVHRVERTTSSPLTVGGGELLLPGELVLAAGETYTSPWVHVAASDEGLDGVAAAFHGYQRALPAHPSGPRPVTLNVWEAVFFDHDLTRLRELADIAASLGVERYVLDDGWFGGRRDDDAGLGDWWVAEDVWPDGLAPLVDHVRSLGMRFGLWFEPEMVNPDSDLYRAHPEWVLSADGRTPLLQRNQLVLDLSQPAVVAYLVERVDAVLSAYDIDYVKWDHNRDLLEAGSPARAHAPAVHAQTEAFYRLLDTLRERHPHVEWETCAGGGGRIDLGVLSRVQRVWTSDMTDALSRQEIQRWTTQLAAPEYQGAHVSRPESHQTGRVLPLDFRAATALFGHFGIEWDLTSTDAEERAALARWVAVYKEYRELLHTGRVVRVPTQDPAVLQHGVVAPDGRTALLAQAQLDDSVPCRPLLPFRVPHLDPAATYRARWVGPAPGATGSPYQYTAPPEGPFGDVTVGGRALASSGVPMPRRAPHTVTLVELSAVP